MSLCLSSHMLYVVCICNLASIYPNFLYNFQILLLSISFKIYCHEAEKSNCIPLMIDM